MTHYERLACVLQGKRAPLAWYADLSWIYTARCEAGDIDEKYLGETGYLQYYRDLGAGICFYAPTLWDNRMDERVKVESVSEGGRRVTTWTTPNGSVRQVEKFLPSSYTWAITEHYVKDFRDLEVMAEAVETSVYTPNYEAFTRTAAQWQAQGDGTAVGLSMASTEPLQMLLSRWAGAVNTLDLYMEDVDRFESMLERLRLANEPMIEIVANAPCSIIEMPENLAADITGRNFFTEYNMPYYQKLNRRLHAAGKKTGIHNDGSLKGTFGLLGQCGFDFVEAVTPEPVGDIALEELRQASGSDIVIWGGLPGAMFSPNTSEEEFRRHLRQAVDVFTRDGRCVLGVADQVPPDGLESRVRLVSQTVG